MDTMMLGLDFVPKTENVEDEADNSGALTSSSIDVQTAQRAKHSELKEIKFVQLLGMIGTALLEKSQTTTAKQKKKAAADKMCEMMATGTSERYTPSQIIKKVANLRQRLKHKTDVRRTGHIPLRLKASEKMFLDLLPAEEKQNVDPIDFVYEMDLPNFKEEPPIEIPFDTDATLPCESDSNTSHSTIASEKRECEDFEEETKTIDNCELQRIVLTKQLELFKKQTDMFEAQEKRNTELHIQQLKVLELKETLLKAKLRALQNT